MEKKEMDISEFFLESINALRSVEVPIPWQCPFIDKLESGTPIRCILSELNVKKGTTTIDFSLREVPTPGGSYDSEDLASITSGKLHEVQTLINPN